MGNGTKGEIVRKGWTDWDGKWNNGGKGSTYSCQPRGGSGQKGRRVGGGGRARMGEDFCEKGPQEGVVGAREKGGRDRQEQLHLKRAPAPPHPATAMQKLHPTKTHIDVMACQPTTTNLRKLLVTPF